MRWYIQLLHLIAIAGVLVFVWIWVFREKHGPMVVALTGDHGIHEGDIPVLVGGSLIVALLAIRLWMGSR